VGLCHFVYSDVRLLALILILIPLTPKKANPSYLALGDSYTIGESVGVEDRYPVQAMRMLHLTDTPDIIATTGWTTADLLRALSAAKPATGYQVVSLLIGVNNQYQGRSQTEYGEQFTELLKAAIDLAGNRPSHVIVLSIPDYSVTPFARQRDTAFIAAQIDSFNRVNNRIAADFKVNYLDITAESRKAASDLTLIAGDGLHFSGKEYGIWASMMAPVLKKQWE
jgi:lysophospholipase L1-like esterase